MSSNQDDPSRYKKRLESQLDKLGVLSDQNAKTARRVIHKGEEDVWAASTARNHARALRYLIEYGETEDEYPDNANEWGSDTWNKIVDDVAIERDVGTGQKRQYSYAARAFARFSIDSEAEKDEIDAPTYQHKPISEEEVLSRAEVLKLVKSASHIRDKALIATMYEAALRRGAIVQIDIKHYSNRRNWGTMKVPDRPGVKTASNAVKPISWSKGYLDRWLDSHPNSDDPNAPLFCSIRDRDEGQRLTTQAVYTQFSRIVERSDFDNDRIHPHLLRHSRATAMRASENHAKDDIEQVLDWDEGSAMHDRYEHVSQLTEAERVAISMGLDVDKETPASLDTCPQCRTTIPPESDSCPVCLLEFDVSAPDWFDVFQEAAPDSDPLLQKWDGSATAAPKIHELNPVQLDHVFEIIAFGLSLSEEETLLDLFIPEEYEGSISEISSIDVAETVLREIENQRTDLQDESPEYQMLPEEALRHGATEVPFDFVEPDGKNSE